VRGRTSVQLDAAGNDRSDGHALTVSFVSLLSSSGVIIEEIAHLVGYGTIPTPRPPRSEAALGALACAGTTLSGVVVITLVVAVLGHAWEE
jgi:hypothetical protein